MTGTVLVLAVGSLLLVAGLLFRRASLLEGRLDTVMDAQEVLNALQLELLPNWFVDRLFSGEDWDFASSEVSSQITSLFERERTIVALLWLKHTQEQVARLMDFHLRMARQRPDLKPSAELKLSLEYVRFQVLCKAMAGLLRMVGPIRVRNLAAWTVHSAGNLGAVSETFLTRLDHAAVARAE